MNTQSENAAMPIRDTIRWSKSCTEIFSPWNLVKHETSDALKIVEAGISHVFPGYQLGRRKPRFHLLVYPVLGQGFVFGTEFEGRVGPGEILSVAAATPFGYRPDSAEWRFVWFHLNATAAVEKKLLGSIAIRPSRAGATLAFALENFNRECRKRGAVCTRLTKLYGELIETELLRDLEHKSGVIDEPTEDSRLAFIWDTVRSDPARDWSVEELAKLVSMSSPSLFRWVRKINHSSPLKIVTQIRMERAQELLIFYDYPVRMIAEQVGYQDEFAFSVAFKRFSGVSPTTFRRRRMQDDTV